MRARFLLLLAAALVATFGSANVSVQAPQPQPGHEVEPTQLLGTWRLNVAKSKYSPGPPMRDETRVYTRGPQGIAGVVTRTYADGHVERYEYVANFGREYMVTGNPAYDAVTLKRIDENESEAVLSHAGTVYGVARRLISPDGKTMTIRFDRKNADVPVHNVAIYDRQP
jgi:hypothetical protein